MNDWWDYLEHGWFGKNGQKGSEKKNHKYYARIPTGTKDGHNVYRYFLLERRLCRLYPEW